MRAGLRLREGGERLRGKGGADWGRIRGFGSFDPAASTIVLLDFCRSHLIRGYLLIKKRWTSGIAGRNDSSRSIRRQDHNSWFGVCFLKHTVVRCSSFLREDCKLDHRFFDSAPANGVSFPDDPWSSRLRVADWGRPTEIRVGFRGYMGVITRNIKIFFCSRFDFLGCFGLVDLTYCHSIIVYTRCQVSNHKVSTTKTRPPISQITHL